MKALLARLLLAGVMGAALAGCTVRETQAPALTGPSEFALSFGVTATPDAIGWDGGSQSSIVVSAYDANGRPLSAVTFRLDMLAGGIPADYGSLAARTVVTNGSGRATTVYTAPAPLPAGANLPTCSASGGPGVPGDCVDIVATPIGSGFETARSQGVTIRLVPLGAILPPAATPTAAFNVSPTTATANSPIQFDASPSCPGPASTSGCQPAGTLVSYEWNFGDGGSATGPVVAHSYGTAQTYSVTLTVTNDRGVKASLTKTVAVGAGQAPTATFVFSPTAPAPGTEVYFDASGSRPGLGHRIVQYRWNWGDGDTVVSSSSPQQGHDYVAEGTYTVTLTVVDEVGQIGTVSTTVPVKVPKP